MLKKNVETFLECNKTYKEAEIVLFGAPFDSTTSFRPGTRFGSSAIRHESFGLESYSPYQDKDLIDSKVMDSGDLELCFGNTKKVLSDIKRRTEGILKDGKLPFMLVGDNRIFQFGIRSGDREEFRWGREHVCTRKFDFQGLREVLEQLQGKPVYFTLDLDVLDPSVFPGTGTPEPGGVSFDQLRQAATMVCEKARNFNPEINIREVSAKGSYWEDGHWVETEPMEIKRVYNFEEVGEKDMYLLHHEEIESLALNMPGIKRIRFFMTFGQSYLTHLKCLENVGMTSIEPILFEGKEIVPLQFLKAVLPDPASLGPRTKGKTNIGCIFQGKKDGKEKTYYLYNICDHESCYKEVGSQAVAYTTGVPAMIGAMMVMTGKWNKPGVHNIEEFDPDPFMDALNTWGLPWRESHTPVLVD
ncbi:saccharopine dehydrogenase C-terminal domain-containing protein [Blautia sp.]|uniref:saccharopine dehydrogenase C-terminal domain-containing protein n=1 Tax=Blautia sp. TaxID=1955243 RepID=UPI002E75B053|nr:saccharopine dehydrogenase C-terminal domain-containing protein [Blautia sp.]MEE0810250.1 saccharopine dehydrogenase C-terminal domain-containing protein [Blautia sp.]